MVQKLKNKRNITTITQCSVFIMGRRKTLKKLLEIEIALKTTQLLMIFHVVVGIVVVSVAFFSNCGFIALQGQLLNASLALTFLSLLSGIVSIYCDVIRILRIENLKKRTGEIVEKKKEKDRIEKKEECRMWFLRKKLRKFSKHTSIMGKTSHTIRRVFSFTVPLLCGTDISKISSMLALVSIFSITGNIFYLLSFSLVLVLCIIDRKYEDGTDEKENTKNKKVKTWHFILILFTGHALNYLREKHIVHDLVLENGITIVPGVLLVLIGMCLNLTYACAVLCDITKNCSSIAQKLQEETISHELSCTGLLKI